MKLQVPLSAAFLLLTLPARSQTVDHPLQIGGDVAPPKLVKQVDPKYPRPLFGRPKQGETTVGLVVDEHGMPQNLHIVRTADKKLDAAATEAVRQYRFEPAIKAGAPVAVQLNVAVNFRIF